MLQLPKSKICNVVERQMKKIYVLVGASGRAINMFAKPIVERFSDCAEIKGVMDVNPLRVEAFKELSGLSCPSYTDFDKMIAEESLTAALSLLLIDSMMSIS